MLKKMETIAQAHCSKDKTPRPYLSWSQLSLFEKDPNLYYQVYVEGLDQFRTKYLELGKRMADVLENGFDEEHDPMFEYIGMFMPSYPHREFQIPRLINEGEKSGCKCSKCLARGIEKPLVFEGVPLYGKLDGFDDKTLTIGEYKTGKKWTQGMVDKADQLTFYTLLVWLKYKKFPKKIFLHWARTDEDLEGNLKLVGEIKTFETKRRLADLILLSKRIKNAWKGINEMSKFVLDK